MYFSPFPSVYIIDLEQGRIYWGIPQVMHTLEFCEPPIVLIKVNLLTTSVPHYKETNQSINRANQLTGFYMMGNIGS